MFTVRSFGVEEEMPLVAPGTGAAVTLAEAVTDAGEDAGRSPLRGGPCGRGLSQAARPRAYTGKALDGRPYCQVAVREMRRRCG
jgi:hypothetical protein